MLPNWRIARTKRIQQKYELSKSKVLNFNKLKPKQREMLRNIVEKSEKTIDVWVHPYYGTEYGDRINIKAIQDASKSKRPLFVFVERQRYDILKKRFEEMGLSVPVIFIKTQLGSSKIDFTRKQRRIIEDKEEDGEDTDLLEEKWDKEKAKRLGGRLLNLGIENANVFGEVFAFSPARYTPKVKWKGGCVQRIIEMLKQEGIKRKSSKVVKAKLDTTKTRMIKYY